jgi:hypothetical protein
MLAQFTFGGDVTIERRAGDAAEFLAEFADPGIPVFHRGLGEADLRFGQPNFRPPLRPRACAACNHAIVHSRISSRSNSARAAKMPKTSLPFAVVVSMFAPCPVSTLKPMPRSAMSCAVSTRCLRLRPSRSIFQTTSVSPLRRAFRQAARAGRSSFLLEARSSWRLSGLTLAAISASRCRSSLWLPSALEMRVYPMRMSAPAVRRP